MARYMSSLTWTPQFLTALSKDPQDREPALRTMLAATGVELLAYYVDPAAATVYLIYESDDPGAADAITYQVAAAGQVDTAGMRTIRILTSAEFAGVAKQAGQAGYRAPGA